VRGWEDWYRVSTPAGARRFCSESANPATGICEHYSSIGARSALRTVERRKDLRSVSLSRLKCRQGPNVAAVRSPTATRACCGRYSPRVRVIEQHRFPPASPKLVEGRRAENGYYQPEIAQVVFDDDGEPVRPALSKPELRRGPRGHTSDEVESARIPSGPGVSKCHPSRRPDICKQPILSIER
jgi:hypothetical protein